MQEAEYPSFFTNLIWQQDRMILSDLVFRLEANANEKAWELGDDCFRFWKNKDLMDQYARFLSTRMDFQPRNIFELGTWDGGSVALWFECFRPLKHVSIDRLRREDSDYFKKYVRSRNLGDRIRTHWGVNQGDADRLRYIAKTDFSAPLDLVIDDASHMYGLTKASFEALFPLLRPGGLYIIEDWAWGHSKDFIAPAHWALMKEPTKLIFELVEATGTSEKLIGSMSIFQGFSVVERGPIGLSDEMRLSEFIYKRSRSLKRITRKSVRATLSAAYYVTRLELRNLIRHL